MNDFNEVYQINCELLQRDRKSQEKERIKKTTQLLFGKLYRYHGNENINLTNINTRNRTSQDSIHASEW